MPDKCCIVNCRSNYAGEADGYVSVFRFPKEPERKCVWLRNIHRANWEPSSHSVVCVKHFSESVIIRHEIYKDASGTWKEFPRKKLILLPEAVPTIFPNLPAYLGKDTPTARRYPNKRRKKMIEDHKRQLQGTMETMKAKEDDIGVEKDSLAQYESPSVNASQVIGLKPVKLEPKMLDTKSMKLDTLVSKRDASESGGQFSLHNPLFIAVKGEPSEKGYFEEDWLQRPDDITYLRDEDPLLVGADIPMAVPYKEGSISPLSGTHFLRDGHRLCASAVSTTNVLPVNGGPRDLICVRGPLGDMYRCSNCSHPFFNSSMLRRHQAHCGRKRSCTISTQRAPLPPQKGPFFSEDESSFPCTTCGEVFTGSALMYQHRKRVHQQEFIHHCGECDKIFQSKGALTKHEVNHHEIHVASSSIGGETSSQERGPKRQKSTEVLAGGIA